MNINFNEITAGVMIKIDDNIKSSDIIDCEESLLKDEGKLDEISKTCFKKIDKEFINRINYNKGGFLVCGENFLEDSCSGNVEKLLSNLGVKGILAKSFNKNHKENLIKNGILPMKFVYPKEYDEVGLYDILKVKNLLEDLSKGILEVINITKGDSFWVKLEL